MNKEKEEKLQRKLRELSNAQDSIQSLSAWIMHYREFAPQIVQIWLEGVREADMFHRLSLFYLANDVLQASRKRNYSHYVDAFALVLNEATSLARGKEIKHEVERVYSIWEDRLIYSSEFIAELREALEMPIRKTQKIRVKKISVSEPEVNNYEVDLKNLNPDEYTKIIAEFKPKNLVALLKQIEDLEKDSKAKFLGVQDTQFEEPPEKMLRSIKVEQASYHNFDQQLEECAFYLEEYILALEKEHEHQTKIEEALKHAAIYYTTQAKEARVVVKAYKSFTARVKNVEKKLNKIKPVLLSPVPSPPSDYDGSPAETKDGNERSYTPPLSSLPLISPGTASSSQTSLFVEPDTTVPHTSAAPSSTPKEANVSSSSTSKNLAGESSASSPNSHQSAFLAPDSTSVEITSTPEDAPTSLGDSGQVMHPLSPPSVLPLLSPPSLISTVMPSSSISASLPSSVLQQPPVSPSTSLPSEEPPLPTSAAAAPPLPPTVPLTTLPPLPATVPVPPALPPAPLSNFETSCQEIPLPPSPSHNSAGSISTATSTAALTTQNSHNFGQLPPPPPLCSSLSANGSTTQSIVSPIMSNISGLPPAAFAPSPPMMGSFNYPSQYGYYTAAAYAASYASFAAMQAAHNTGSSAYNSPMANNLQSPSTSEAGPVLLPSHSDEGGTASANTIPSSSATSLTTPASTSSHLPSDDKSGIDDDMELDDSEEESGGVIEIFSRGKHPEILTSSQSVMEGTQENAEPLLLQENKLEGSVQESIGAKEKCHPHNAMAVGSILDTLDALDREFNATFKKDDSAVLAKSSNLTQNNCPHPPIIENVESIETSKSPKLSVLDTLDELDREFNASFKKDSAKESTLPSTSNSQSDKPQSLNVPPKMEKSLFEKALEIPGIDDLLKTISSSPLLLKTKPDLNAPKEQVNDMNLSDSNSSFASVPSSTKSHEKPKPLSPPPLPLSLGDFSSFLHKTQESSPALTSPSVMASTKIANLASAAQKGNDNFLPATPNFSYPTSIDMNESKNFKFSQVPPAETILDSIDMDVSNNSNISHSSFGPNNENLLASNNVTWPKANFENTIKSDSSFDIYTIDESQNRVSHPNKCPSPQITNLNKEYDSNATSDNAFSYVNSPLAKVSLPQSGFSFKDHLEIPPKENLGDEYENFCSQINAPPEYAHEVKPMKEGLAQQGKTLLPTPGTSDFEIPPSSLQDTYHKSSPTKWTTPPANKSFGGSTDPSTDPKFYEDSMDMEDMESHFSRTDFNKTQFCSPPMPNFTIQMPVMPGVSTHFTPFRGNRTPRPRSNHPWTSNARRSFDRNFAKHGNPRHHYY